MYELVPTGSTVLPWYFLYMHETGAERFHSACFEWVVLFTWSHENFTADPVPEQAAEENNRPLKDSYLGNKHYDGHEEGSV